MSRLGFAIGYKIESGTVSKDDIIDLISNEPLNIDQMKVKVAEELRKEGLVFTDAELSIEPLAGFDPDEEFQGMPEDFTNTEGMIEIDLNNPNDPNLKKFLGNTD